MVHLGLRVTGAHRLPTLLAPAGFISASTRLTATIEMGDLHDGALVSPFSTVCPTFCIGEAAPPAVSQRRTVGPLIRMDVFLTVQPGLCAVFLDTVWITTVIVCCTDGNLTVDLLGTCVCTLQALGSTSTAAAGGHASGEFCAVERDTPWIHGIDFTVVLNRHGAGIDCHASVRPGREHQPWSGWAITGSQGDEKKTE